MAESYPYQGLFARVFENLQAWLRPAADRGAGLKQTVPA